MRAVWKPLIVDRAWNAELRAAATDASGAYVVRRKADRVVLYVGMSETGHLWRTMTRHFHDWKALPKHFWSADGTRLVRGGESFQHARPELLEAALFVTSVRRRTKHTPDRLARNLEADLISRYKPIVNLDPGHAWDDRDATRAVRRRGKHGASPASEEPVPEAEIEDDAREPEVYEDTSDDPDDPFAVRNPAMAKKKNPRSKLSSADAAEERAFGKRLAAGMAAEERAAMKQIGAEQKKIAALSKKFPAGSRVVLQASPAVWGGTVATIERWQTLSGDLVMDDGRRLLGLDARALSGMRAAQPGEASPSRGDLDPAGTIDRALFGSWGAAKLIDQAEGHERSAPSHALEQARRALEGAQLGRLALAELGVGPADRRAKQLAGVEERAEALIARLSRPEGYGAEDGKRAGQLRMFNPSKPKKRQTRKRHNPAQRARAAHVPRTANAEKPEGYLVELGKLTAIEASSRVGGTISSAKWSPRSAPILAYDLRGRLFIVYTDGTTTRAARGSEKSRYKATHWGQEGRGELQNGAIVTGSCKVWGVGTRITYTTKKGEDRELVDYVHEWGEGATGEWEAPLVVSHGTRYALAGGTYRVDTRGIVG